MSRVETSKRKNTANPGGTLKPPPIPRFAGLKALARRRRPWLRAALGLALLALLFAAVDVQAVVRSIEAIDPLRLALAAGLTVLINLVKPLRWRLLLATAVPSTSYRQALRSLLIAASARTLLPTKLGEFARIAGIDNLTVAAGTALTAVDILLEAAAVFALASIGAYAFSGLPLAAALVVAAALVAVALAHPNWLLGKLTRLPGLGARLVPKLSGASPPTASGDGQQAPMGAPAGPAPPVVPRVGLRPVGLGLALTLVLDGLRYAQLALLLSALGQAPSLSALMLMPFIHLADSFPVSLGGVGPRELVSLTLLPKAGIAAEAGVAAVLAQTLLSNLLPTLAGLAWLACRWARRAESRPPPRPQERGA